MATANPVVTVCPPHTHYEPFQRNQFQLDIRFERWPPTTFGHDGAAHARPFDFNDRMSVCRPRPRVRHLSEPFLVNDHDLQLLVTEMWTRRAFGMGARSLSNLPLRERLNRAQAHLVNHVVPKLVQKIEVLGQQYIVADATQKPRIVKRMREIDAAILINRAGPGVLVRILVLTRMGFNACEVSEEFKTLDGHRYILPTTVRQQLFRARRCWARLERERSVQKVNGPKPTNLDPETVDVIVKMAGSGLRYTKIAEILSKANARTMRGHLISRSIVGHVLHEAKKTARSEARAAE